MRYLFTACALLALANFSFQTPASGAPMAPPSVNQTPSAAFSMGGRVTVAPAAMNILAAPASAPQNAQGIAASQVASTGRQTLTLGRDGTASGGTMVATMLPGNFIVPQNVSAILDFSNGRTMTAGNFVNNGTVYCVSNNPNVTNAAINVKSFLNAANAQISTSLSLSIASKTTFTNLGNITAAGDLDVTTATSLANFGVMRSQNGNVSLTGTTNAFEVGNVGHIYALNGEININQLSKSRNSLDINGGQWTAKALNVNAPNSKVHFVANDISAVVNVAAKNLQIGSVWNPVSLGSVPASTTIVSAPAPEALPVSATTRFGDSDYIVDTEED